MPIRFVCPVCQTSFTVTDRDAGKNAECTKCGQRLQVPSPPRSKTILGELCPGESAPSSPHRPPSRLFASDKRPAAVEARPTLPPPPTGPIRFECPACKTNYSVNRLSAGKEIDCRTCGGRLTVPGTPMPVESPRPAPEARISPAEPELVDVPSWKASEQESAAGYDPPSPTDYRRQIGPGTRILAGVGAGLLFVGLFLPIIHGPTGFWMSFVDFPWKAVTVGFAVADEITDRPTPSEARAARRVNDDIRPEKPGRSALVLLVAAVAVVFPLAVMAVVGATAIQIASGTKPKSFFLAGVIALASTVGYAFVVLLLNTIPEFRLPMALLSPGFGWAVVLVGAAMLIVAGMVKADRPC